MPQAAPDEPSPPDRAAAPSRTQPAPRRHRLSVLFCDLCDSTALSASLEAEEYAELLSRLREAYEATIARHGGTVVRIQGDGMLAVFGHPLPREGDGRRAVEAALQLHEAVRGLAAPAASNRRFKLRLHSGVHAGLVLVQEGNVVIGRLELLGMVPNIAARLSAAAGRDEVLVSEETLGRDRAFFKTGAVRAVHAHGHEQPIDCWPIEGRSEPGALRPAMRAFVGRSRELERLEQRLGEVLCGATRQIAIAGPPGVGKTRLAAEFLRLAERRGCRVLAAPCHSELDAVPLAPLQRLLGGALGLGVAGDEAALRTGLERLGLGPLTAELSALVGAGTSASAKGDGDRGENTQGHATRGVRGPDIESVLQAAARVLMACAERQPLVLFLDDWQWADAATRQALATLVASAARAPAVGLLVLSSNRSVDAGDSTMRHVEVLELAPFSPDEGALSIRALLPRADPFVVDEIYRYSGGNALFIEELCHSARHQQVRLAGQQVGAAWLQVLIESRVARLGAELATLVRTLAVIGNVVPTWLLQAVTGLAPDDATVRELAHVDLLYPDSATTLRFKHGLARDVIYESVGLHERRALHARVAAALQAHAADGGEDPHEALAYHFGAAGRPAEAALHAERGGDRAATLSALDRAKALYRAALSHLEALGLADEAAAGAGAARGADAAGEQSDDTTAVPGRAAGDAARQARTLRWLQVANKLGLVCVFDAARNDLPVFERAVRLAACQSDASLHARAEYWLGYILYALGQARDAVRHCERAAALAGDGGDPLAVQIRATLGQALAAASRYAGAEPLLVHAVEVKRTHRRGAKTPVGLAYSLVCLASVHGDRGEFGPATELLDEAWALLQGVTHEIGASIQGWRAVILTWQGRWAEALAAAQESTAIAERTHSLFQFCQGRATAAYAAWVLSGDDAAIDRLAESTQWLEPRESGLFRSLDHGWLAEGWFARGERALAREHGARALLRARAGDVIGVALACRALARDAAQWRRPERAQHWLARAERIARQRESRHEAAANCLCAAEIALAADDRAGARRAADAALSACEPLQMRWHAERAQRLLAAL